MLYSVLVLVALCGSSGAQKPLSTSSFRYPSAPLLPIAPLFEYNTQRVIYPESSRSRANLPGAHHRATGSHGGAQSPAPPPQVSNQGSSGNPCQPSPCGPNTACTVDKKNVAVCRCQQDFVPDGNTITGCKPQCLRDSDCPLDYRCRLTKCEKVCYQTACGFDAICTSRNHQLVCKCPIGYVGNPDISCSREQNVQHSPAVSDPCSPNECGTNARCTSKGNRAVCTCPHLYELDSLNNCVRVQCSRHEDCPSDQACQDRRCIDPCHSRRICGVNALCESHNHQVICSCSHFYEGDPLLHCKRKPTNVQHSPAVSDPCSPNKCGTNARCTSQGNRAVCTCPHLYELDSLNNCVRFQCSRDEECPTHQACHDSRCIDPCHIHSTCGVNALCEIVSRHQPLCSCPHLYEGNPYSHCKRKPLDVLHSSAVSDPCSPNKCGTNAQCTSQGDRAVCTCPHLYEFDSLNNCVPVQCSRHVDCPSHQACRDRRCIDPCDISDICGVNALCEPNNNHQPVCTCPSLHEGDALIHCRRKSPESLCDPSPCGANTNCRVADDRPVCSCMQHYKGNPLPPVGCRPECVRSNECDRNFDCRNNRCVNPCSQRACGEGANCNARNGQAICTCPEHYIGSPYSRCYTECSEHGQCRSYQACVQFKCVDPCLGQCGTGADCKVEQHSPICSCPRGYTGDPFINCVKFTLADLCRPNPCGRNADCVPGKDRQGNDRPVCTCMRGHVGDPISGCRKGACETNRDCASYLACFNYDCQNTCTTQASVCGQNANCVMREHLPRCSCFHGYEGDPFTYCRVSPISRFIVGRSK